MLDKLAFKPEIGESTKKKNKKIYLIFWATEKKVGFGSVNQRYGSVDPIPNVKIFYKYFNIMWLVQDF